MPYYQLKPWAESKALIVNDDGIDAEGIKVLEGLARSIFAKVVVVAPSHEHSGMGHAVSYKKLFNLHKIDEDHYAVEGTPADCAIVGLEVVLKDSPPDVVLSGINHGENAGNSIAYSGTFGGAFEAGLAGIPSIAFSQTKDHHGNPDFAVARRNFAQVLEFLQHAPWPDHVVMNVNFPAKDQDEGHELLPTHQGRHHIIDGVDVTPHGNGSHVLSIRFKNKVVDNGLPHDLDVLARKGVTITPVLTNWTCHETLALWAK
ncbi:MAG: 5'/3'-nucleotidase SurE [Pseudobdellovibrionaceae bacterium]